ncbi:MAG TPA: glucan biosynthesis protein [Polyangiaceae bacterium]|nr:glucan biosynthesis protein [Polyangiaceae bacterium]
MNSLGVMHGTLSIGVGILAAGAVVSCGNSERSGRTGAQLCDDRARLADRRAEAEANARLEFVSQNAESCLELDRPEFDSSESSGEVAGLDAGEYAALVRDANGNFYDDGTWWLKGAPRGEVHVDPVRLSSERCESVTFERLGFNYSAARPPIWDVPECGKYLTGLYAGSRTGSSWPQLLHIDGSGWTRLAALEKEPAFGSYVRLLGSGPANGDGSARVIGIDVVTVDSEALRLRLSLDGPDFSGLMDALLAPGNPSRLFVEVSLFPRAGRPLSRLPLATLSGGFLRGRSDTPENDTDEAHDADRIEVQWDDESRSGWDWAELVGGARGSGWETLAAGEPGDRVKSMALIQSERAPERYAAEPEARYARRPDLGIREIRSDLPLFVELAFSARPMLEGNAAVTLMLDATRHDSGPIRVSYIVEAAVPTLL